MDSEKDFLRKTNLKKLSELSEDELVDLSKSLSINLRNLIFSLSLKNPLLLKKVASFAPMKKEPLWFLDFLKLQSEYSFFFPVIKDEEKIEFLKVGLGELKELHWKKKITGEVCASFGFFLVPGLAFSKDGKRLGRGRGYYDRYLQTKEGIKIGVCFSMQLEKSIPVNENDIYMDYIVTEKEIINTKGEY